MFKHPFVQQKKQKLLNYEIKMIEGCQDSLFTEGDCQHQRYLGWGLCENLKKMLKKYCYNIRWIGNDHDSYIFAYFYVVIMGCAANPNFMVELKTVFYDLAQKYLAQFEQKLLIQFLCLIEYSQERYIFFRKYSKIEEILLKIFKQIQERNSYQLQLSVEPAPSQESNSSKSNNGKEIIQGKYQNEINLVSSTSNSNTANNNTYENKCYMADKGLWKSKEQHSCVKWYQIYNQYFSFVCMEYLTDQNIKLSIDLPKKGILDIDSFVITIEKGCFFIVELTLLKKGGELYQKENRCSIVDASKAYVNQLIQKELQESQIKKNSFSFTNQITKNVKNQKCPPKFLANRKKQIFGDVNAENGQLDGNYDSQRPKTIKQVLPEQTPSSSTSILPLKNKIIDLYNIKNTIESNRPQRNALRQQIRSHPLYEEYKKNIRSNPKDEKPDCFEEKHSRFAQYIQQTKSPRTVLGQNKSLDSSTQRAMQNLRKINSPTSLTHNAQQTINNQNSVLNNVNMRSERTDSKIQTGLTLATETNLSVSFKSRGLKGKVNKLNVRNGLSPTRRFKSTSPGCRIVSKGLPNFNEGSLLSAGKRSKPGHHAQISFDQF